MQEALAGTPAGASSSPRAPRAGQAAWPQHPALFYEVHFPDQTAVTAALSPNPLPQWYSEAEGGGRTLERPRRVGGLGSLDTDTPSDLSHLHLAGRAWWA